MNSNSTIIMNSWNQFLDVIGKSCDMEDVWMCRKCFLAYESFWDLRKEITKKISMAMITQDHGSCSSAHKQFFMHIVYHNTNIIIIHVSK